MIEECYGRSFRGIPGFETLYRVPGRTASNWIVTVEYGYRLNRETGARSAKPGFRITRWRARNDETDKSVKYWESKKGYNVNSAEQLEDISNILNDFLEGTLTAEELIRISAEEYRRLHTEARKQRIKIRDLLAEIRNLKSINSVIDAERQTFKQRLSNMRENIGDLEPVLRGYGKLLLDETANETEIKEYIEDHRAYWMFGLEYVDIRREVGFPFGKGRKDFYFDFMLERHDSYLDLVECKGPNESLFDRRTKKRSKPGSKLSEAIGQVFKYLYAVDKTWDENVVKPKAYIVIGKEESGQSAERRIFSSYLSNTEIITYSELYERGRRLLKHIKTAKLGT